MKSKIGDWMFVMCAIAFVAFSSASPTVYKRNEDNIFEPVMVPVSSTVIPLPIYKVEYGLRVDSKDKKSQIPLKPNGNLKLITIKKYQEKEP